MTSTVSSAEPLVQGAFFKPCELSAPFNWQPGLLRKLDELRCMGQFCDVTIQVDDTIGDASFLPYMRVHSVIVAAGSPMLHEKLQDPSFAGSVLVAGVGVWQWEQVINFLYTGKVCLTASGQAEALVQAAIELKMEVLVNMLQDHLGPSDAAAVEDVKPLKSRQAADTSEPMDDDDEDNDAGGAAYLEDTEEEDSSFEPVHKRQRSSRWKQRKPRRMVTAAAADEHDDENDDEEEEHEEQNEEDEHLESLPKSFKLEPYEGEGEEALYLYDMKLNRNKQKESATPPSKPRPNYKEDESEDSEEEIEESQDELDLLKNWKQRKERILRKRTKAKAAKRKAEEAAKEPVLQLKVADFKPGGKIERGKAKKLKFCEDCQQLFLNEKNFLKHKCLKKKPIVPRRARKSVIESRKKKQPVPVVHASTPSLEERNRLRRQKKVNTTCKLCRKNFTFERAYLNHNCKPKTGHSKRELRKKYEKYICNDSELIDLPLPGTECAMCGEQFPDHKLLFEHTKTVHDVEMSSETPKMMDIPQQCPYCKTTEPREKLIAHIWEVHCIRVKGLRDSAVLNYFKCHDCEYRTKLSHRIDRHIKEVHFGQSDYMCEICGQSLKRKLQYENHMRIHTDEKPFLCKFCPTTFRSMKTLRKHELLHVGYKPYKCNLCGDQFVQSVSVNCHIEKHHPHIPKNKLRENRTYTPLSEAQLDSSEVRPVPEFKRSVKSKKQLPPPPTMIPQRSPPRPTFPHNFPHNFPPSLPPPQDNYYQSNEQAQSSLLHHQQHPPFTPAQYSVAFPIDPSLGYFMGAPNMRNQQNEPQYQKL